MNAGLMLCLPISCCLLNIAVAGPQQTGSEESPVPPLVYARGSFSQAPAGLTGSKEDLILLTESRCALWLNGQSVLRKALPHAINDQQSAVRVRVGHLLRSGNNMIGLTIPSEDQLPVILGPDRQPLAISWKVSPTTAPPVGWQLTDFNDRDWKPPIAAPSQASAKIPDQEQLKALPPVSEIRIPAPREGAFRFRDGDHVVLIGPTWIERSQEFGHLETVLSLTTEGRVTFRNLGWSGDTVRGTSRAMFDREVLGYLRLVEHVRAEQPSVVMVAYGQNEPFENNYDPAAFQRDLKTLIADLSTTGAEIVLLSPLGILPTRSPLPNLDSKMPALQQAADVIQSVADTAGVRYVPLTHRYQDGLFEASLRRNGVTPGELSTVSPPPADGSSAVHSGLFRQMALVWSDNGMHLNDYGYQCLAIYLRDALAGHPSLPPTITIRPQSKSVSSAAVAIRSVEWGKARGEVVRLEIREARMSSEPVRVELEEYPLRQDNAILHIASTSTDDPETVERSTGRKGGWMLPANPLYDELADLIVRKNELYFHRWRPQNITYLYGFRKHEQGRNASEIARFDPLIEQLETEIHTRKKGGWRTIVIRYPQ